MSRMMLAMRTALAVALSLCPLAAEAQSVRDIANRGACSTAGVQGLANQLIETQQCLSGGGFVPFAPHGNIATASRVHPFLQASARDALWRASNSTYISVSSAFRTLAEQYVLYHSGGCGLAAQPGRSNHQSGRAVDVSNWSAARGALQAAGCAWLGSSDPVHFDCPGGDRRSDTIRAFQRLWNVNHPSDRIAEDGVYGAATASRLGRSPAGGFATGGCGCETTCVDDTHIRGASCGVGDCAVFGARCVDDSRGARCVSAFCEPTGRQQHCLDDGDTLLTCDDGAPSTGSCGAFGARCVEDSLGARCASVFCQDRGDHRSCLPDGDTLIRCQDGGITESGSCGVFGATCVQEGDVGRCVSVFCDAEGLSDACIPDTDTLVRCDGGNVSESLDCAEMGGTCIDTAGGARCTSPMCAAAGASSSCAAGGEVLVRCDAGAVMEERDCALDGATCEDTAGGARCVAPECPSQGASEACTNDGRLISCDAGAIVASVECGEAGCASDESGARCGGCGGAPARCAGSGSIERCADGETHIEPCPGDYICDQTSGPAQCVEPQQSDVLPRPDAMSGCTVSAAPGHSPLAAALGGLLALLVLRRTRRRGYPGG